VDLKAKRRKLSRGFEFEVRFLTFCLLGFLWCCEKWEKEQWEVWIRKRWKKSEREGKESRVAWV